MGFRFLFNWLCFFTLVKLSVNRVSLFLNYTDDRLVVLNFINNLLLPTLIFRINLSVELHVPCLNFFQLRLVFFYKEFTFIIPFFYFDCRSMNFLFSELVDKLLFSFILIYKINFGFIIIPDFVIYFVE